MQDPIGPLLQNREKNVHLNTRRELHFREDMRVAPPGFGYFKETTSGLEVSDFFGADPRSVVV